jgi:cobalt-zinc-cadmium efflux system membrane fusion protein
LLLMAVFLAACSRHEEPQQQAEAPSTPGVVIVDKSSPKLSKIRVAQVVTVDAPGAEVLAPGKLEVDANRISRVILPVAGRIAKVEVKIGDSVRQGQTVLELQSSDADAAEAALLQADSALLQARAARDKAKADSERIMDLYEHGAIAKKELVAAQSELARTEGGVTQAEAAVTLARQRITLMGLTPGVRGQLVPVRAPLGGKVLELAAVAGEFRNNTNDPLMKLADLRTLLMTCDVPESEARLCRAGAAVDLELTAFPNEHLRGRIARVEDTVDPQTRTVKVHAELDNSSARFLPEMTGRMRVSDAPRQLPAFEETAVLYSGGQPLVYIEESPGRFVERPVTLGPRVGNRCTALSGARPGDRIVVEGVIYLKNGL